MDNDERGQREQSSNDQAAEDLSELADMTLADTQPALPAITEAAAPSGHAVDLVYSVFRASAAPQMFWPQERQRLETRAWQQCKLCGQEPIALGFYGREHTQYRFLGYRCRNMLTEQARALEDLLKIPALMVLDSIFTHMRNLEAEDVQARAMTGRVSGSPVPTHITVPPASTPTGAPLPRSKSVKWDV